MSMGSIARGTILAAVLLLLPSAAFAQGRGTDAEPPLETDRPDFTDAAVVVPRGSLQIESGVTFANEPGGLHSFNAAELLLRLGLTSRTELRVVPPQYVRVWGKMRTSGSTDTAIGFKHQLGPIHGFDLAVMGAASLPSGSGAFTTGSVDPLGSIIWARELSDKWGLAGQVAFGAPSAGFTRNFSWNPTLSLERSLGERWSAFLEYAGAFPERGGDVHLIHHGYRYQPTHDSQWDVHFGFGASRAAPDFFIGGGYSARFR